MATDVMILNTAVVDFRSADFHFVEALVGQGGLAKCKTKDMPAYSQEQLRDWIKQGSATAGGPGNSAPLIARAGLNVAVGANLGKGDYDGLDAQGRFFSDVMTSNNIDMSQTCIHPELPTGTTFIYEKGVKERGGIAYFPNANNDFDFEHFKGAVARSNPEIVYYMYSGLSDKGDANSGRDLAEFIKWCRSQGIVTIVDSHTLTSEPQKLIGSGKPVAEYKLLIPLLPEVDLFFTSSDEGKMIENSLATPRDWDDFDENDNNLHFMNFLTERFWEKDGRTRLFGVTISNGAYEKHILPDGQIEGPTRIESKFMAGDVVDLVGAGDSFRAGLITYIARNLDEFKAGNMDFTEAIQMGNLFAALYIKAPLGDRYINIKTYEKMLNVVRSKATYCYFDELMNALK
ncbi:MAG: carbohydrate kinase family protein [Planctomycetota bacterium]|nr:MAG: carbohydrate kinase family protein [Planctomycetota bacterium]